MFRGNVVMKGYLKNKPSTDKAFAGGWFHSGDLGVKHPDGYVQLRDRSKDIIISGGREHFLDRGRGRAVRASRRAARRGGGPAGRQMGRDAVRFRRDEARPWRDRRGAHRMVPGAACALQVPAACGLRRNPEDLDRQGAEIRVARAREADRGGASLEHALRRLAAILPRRARPIGQRGGGAFPRSRRGGAEARP